jgi:hypothetical protein
MISINNPEKEQQQKENVKDLSFNILKIMKR